MFLVDASEYLAYSEDLLSVDCNVGGLTRRSARWLCERKVESLSHEDDVALHMCFLRWIMILECGSACRLPFSPAARSNEPIEHAWPTQYVCMGEETYCIYVYIGQTRGQQSPYVSTHCVVDGEASSHATARGVDVDMDGLGRLFCL